MNVLIALQVQIIFPFLFTANNLCSNRNTEQKSRFRNCIAGIKAKWKTATSLNAWIPLK